MFDVGNDRFPTWLPMEDRPWSKSNTAQGSVGLKQAKMRTAQRKTPKKEPAKNRNPLLTVKEKSKKGEQKSQKTFTLKRSTLSAKNRGDSSASSIESRNDNQLSSLKSHEMVPQFSPRPITPEALTGFKRRLANLLDGLETAQEKIVTLDLAMKSLNKSITTLTVKVSTSDPVRTKLSQLERKKERIMRNLSLIKDYAEKHRTDVGSLHYQLLLAGSNHINVNSNLQIAS